MNDIQICPLFSIHASLCASRAEMPAPTGRRGGPRGPDHLWVPFRSGVGWSALLIALADISKLHCNGLALLPKGVAPNNEHLKYKYACAHHNTKGCTWFVLVYMAKQDVLASAGTCVGLGTGADADAAAAGGDACCHASVCAAGTVLMEDTSSGRFENWVVKSMQ